MIIHSVHYQWYVVGLMAHSHCTGPGQGQGPGKDGFLCYAIYCSHYTRTGTGTGNHCFLLYPSRSQSLSHSRCRAVWMSHNDRYWMLTSNGFALSRFFTNGNEKSEHIPHMSIFTSNAKSVYMHPCSSVLNSLWLNLFNLCINFEMCCFCEESLSSDNAICILCNQIQVVGNLCVNTCLVM